MSRQIDETVEQSDAAESRTISYLEHLRLPEIDGTQSLDDRIKDDLGVDLSTYSSDARQGFLQFLDGLQGFQDYNLKEFSLQSPVHMTLAADIPDDQRDKMNFVQGYLFDPSMRDAVVRSCALLLDHPDVLQSLVMGRMYANYYGELINRHLGDEAIVKIAELSDCEAEIERELNSNIKNDPRGDSISNEMLSRIKHNLRNEAVKIVDKTFGEDLRRAMEYDSEGYMGFFHSLLNPLDKMVVSRKIFLAWTRLLQKEGQLSLESINDCSVEVKAGSDINPDDVLAMENIHERNYNGKYTEEEMEELRTDLKGALNSSSSRFYTLRKGGEIITYVRFGDVVDGKGTNMGSFMTNPEYEGGALGQALLEVASDKELERGPVYAQCDPSLVSFYERHGFVALGPEYVNENGVPTCDIVLESQPSREAFSAAAE